jgi:hypothetical protein
LHTVHTNKLPSGKERWIDLHDIPFAGTKAHKLPQADLYRAMARAGIPGISPTHGHMDLSLILADFLAVQKERAA